MPPKRKAEDSAAAKSSRSAKRPALSATNTEVAGTRKSKNKDAIILTDHAPLTQVGDMFHDMVSRVAPPLLTEGAITLKVATVCSGTDAPIIALDVLQKAVEMHGHQTPFEVIHLFSCEIEGFKQGFIRRNLPNPTIIFRDVVELAMVAHQTDGKALTAGGSKVAVPQDRIDIFFCGCSCVDYSNLNINKTAKNKVRTELQIGIFSTLDPWLLDKDEKNIGNNKTEKPKKVYPVERDKKFEKALDACLDGMDVATLGESMRTFFSALIFIKEKRPKVIILENVDGAPWDMYIDRIFPLVGYKAAFLRLDSKKYYLPQTRQRGYLIAVDVSSSGGPTLDEAEYIMKAWEDAMKSLERAPSASIASFLQMPDDISTIMARANMETSGSTNNTDWGMSSLRHAAERQLYQLDMDNNPFSHKIMRNLKMIGPKFPPHAWRVWWEKQTCRVVDLMDIIEAAGNRSGIYLPHKTCVIDVSQNVDRCTPFNPKNRMAALKQPLGIIGCITPSGEPVVTDLMRPITGTEVMALQGMPVNEMVISSESQDQLRDLAGNAMTVTVVGAATYAALIAINRHCPRLFESVSGTLAPRYQFYLRSPTLFLQPGIQSPHLYQISEGYNYRPVVHDPDVVHQLVKQMVRVCHCPPPVLSSEEEVNYFACKICHTTLCGQCSGNPTHKLVPSSDEEKAIVSSDAGKVLLKSHLPQVFDLQITPTNLDDIRSARQSPTSLTACEIMTSKSRYFYDSIKVTEVVTITYKASRTIARLVISKDSKAHWYIHLTPGLNLASSQTSPTSLPRTFEPSQPIARGDFHMSAEGVYNVRWFFWIPSRIDFTACLEKYDTTTFATVNRKVCRIFKHTPECGTAGNELFTSVDEEGNPQSDTTFILRQCSRTGSPSEDCPVWASEMRKLDYHELRDTYLQAPPDLKLTTLSAGKATQTVFSPGYWTEIQQYCTNSIWERLEPTEIRWGQTHDITTLSSQGENTINPSQPSPSVLAEISTNVISFPMSAARKHMLVPQGTLGQFTVIPSTKCEDFLHDFAFAANAFRDQHLCDRREAVEHFTDWVSVNRSEHWSRPPPEIHISDIEVRNRRQPTEDPDEAKYFEETLLKLPRAISVAARLQDSQLSFLITLQSQVLASRAYSYLLQAHRTIPNGSIAVKEAETHFMVEIDYAKPRSLSFPAFYPLIGSCNNGNMDGIMYEEADKYRQIVLPRFGTRGVQLRTSQRDAVLWMVLREEKPAPFLEVEIDEEVVAPLSVRVLGKATWPTRFPYSSRGGVAAHEIGYGKTVVTLALIDSRRSFDCDASIQERYQIDECWHEEIEPVYERLKEVGIPLVGDVKKQFFLHLSATLVLVPDHLTEQWSREAEKFLGLKSGREVIVIKSVAQFYGGITEEVLRRAELIIMSTKVLSDSFFERLWGFGWGDCDPPFKYLSGRVRERWYRQALRNLRILTASHLAAPGAADAGVQRDFFGLLAREREALLAKIVPDSRRNDQRCPGGKVPASGEQGVKEEGGGEQAPFARADWCASWLHNCSFARVVWDECSYDHKADNKNIPFFVENLVANAKWLLSGTPKVFDLAEVCKTAKVFGVHLARPEPRIMPGLPAITKGPVLDPASKSEEFHVFSSALKSASLAHERHSRAQVFVRYFFRSNRVADDVGSGVSSVEVVLPVHMTALAAVRYHMAHQEVLDADEDFTAMSAHVREQADYSGENLDDPARSCTLLLGLLANGLVAVSRASTLRGLEQSLRRSQDQMGERAKFLWDKTLWFTRWLFLLAASDKVKKNLESQPGIMTIRSMCDGLQTAASNSDFRQYGGEQVFSRLAGTIVGRPGSTNLTWQREFSGNWVERYHLDKAHFTWLNFFEKENIEIPDNLSRKAAMLLAEDLCCLRRKVGINTPPTKIPSPDEVARLFQPGRTIPNSIDPQMLVDQTILASWTDKELVDFIKAYRDLIPDRPVFVASEHLPFTITGLQVTPTTPKELLVSKAQELNMKAGSLSAVKLHKLLWEHSVGIGDAGAYRDGKPQSGKHGTFKEPESQSKMLEWFKNSVVHLSKTMDDYKASIRDMAFIPKFIQFSEASDKDQLLRARQCDGEHCGKHLPSASQSFIVVSCGHILCSACRHLQTTRVCPARNCSAFIKERPVLPCTLLDDEQKRTKTDHIMELIECIIAKEERVLVFAQYQPFIKALWARIRQIDPSATNLTGRGDMSILLEDFKAGNGGSVMLLDIDDDTSAGSNLTIANHIIFANPYMHNNKDHQSRTVEQAKGRCIRHGQEKTVYVYHFMTTHTDEDRLLREHKDDNPAIKSYFDDDDGGDMNGAVVSNLSLEYPALTQLVESASTVSFPWWLEEKKRYDPNDTPAGAVAKTLASPPLSQDVSQPVSTLTLELWGAQAAGRP
ncbi:hypothetical protein B0T21DRAFT_416871 [Apiosordaria backusii]|uniref:SNF2 N-terminal domain-containing protein n=1 Tax=Apiosordaria backusii TaxID=314023 RepID=A0AA39ZS39_9PEZI|nr:hypothetical protein B0T21DRAFT_416871 [Apiosordaria backusii]